MLDSTEIITKITDDDCYNVALTQLDFLKLLDFAKTEEQHVYQKQLWNLIIDYQKLPATS